MICMIVEKSVFGKTLFKTFAIAIGTVIVLTLVIGGIKLLTEDKKTDQSLKISVIDIGKGDCILVQKGEHAMLIDCGYKETSAAVSSYLKSAGVESLESIVITHYDKDHAGGAAAIIGAYSTANIYLPAYEGSSACYTDLISSLDKADGSISSTKVTSDVSFKLGEVSVTIFASDIEYDGDNDNDCSLVVSVRYNKDSYLFAGDLEKAGIAAFLEKHTAQWDIIKMPHHGNKKGNIEELLASVKPQAALITDSDSDPAADSVLELLDAAGVKTYRSSKNGTIVITSSGTGTYRVE